MKEKRPPPLPRVALIVRPVDDGSMFVGLFDCPFCGETHYTTFLGTGERDVFCGLLSDGGDEVHRVDIAVVF